MQPRTKGELLEHYASRDPRPYVQFDGVAWGEVGHDITNCDAERDSGRCAGTWELMDICSDVRVLIQPSTKRKVAIRLLKKTIQWLKNDKDKKHVGEFSPRLVRELKEDFKELRDRQRELEKLPF